MAEHTRFFDKFPIIEYDGKALVNLMQRVDIAYKFRDYHSEFYAYTMEKGETVDQVAFNYYDDVNYDWLIYLANDIIDPYYDIHLDDDTFERYIKNKYGSVERAVKTTKYFRSNWRADDRVLNQSGYDALDSDVKKHWIPIQNDYKVYGYERSKEDFIVTTNKIIDLSFTEESSNTFVKGERVSIDGNNYGEVAWANTTAVTLQHIVGSFVDTVDYEVTGDVSEITVTIDQGSLYEHSSSDENGNNRLLKDVEVSYYSALSAYDYEQELNDSKRDIYLVNNVQAENLNSSLRKLLK